MTTAQPLHNYPHLRPFPTYGKAPRGTLGAMELPFPAVRVYIVADVGNALHWSVDRGGHAHRACQQLFFCPKGLIKVTSTDGRHTLTHTLTEEGSEALYMPPWWWHDMKYQIGSVCVGVASLPYDEKDYLRDKDAFLTLAAQMRAQEALR